MMNRITADMKITSPALFLIRHSAEADILDTSLPESLTGRRRTCAVGQRAPWRGPTCLLLMGGSAPGKLSHDCLRCRPRAPLRVEAVEPKPLRSAPAQFLWLVKDKRREPTLGQGFHIRPGDECQFAGPEKRRPFVRNHKGASSPDPRCHYPPGEDHGDGSSPVPHTGKREGNGDDQQWDRKSKKEADGRSVQRAGHNVRILGVHRQSIPSRRMNDCTLQLSQSYRALALNVGKLAAMIGVLRSSTGATAVGHGLDDAIGCQGQQLRVWKRAQ